MNAAEDPSKLPLRERQAQRLRIEIARTAVVRFLRDGFEKTTIDEIAGDCQVSRRTVFRHFATKEDILLAWPLASADLLRLDVASYPAGSSPLACLRKALVGFAASSERRLPELLSIARLIQDTASLRARSHEVTDAWERRLIDGLVERAAGDAAVAPLAVAVAMATARFGARRWLETGGSRLLSRIIDETFQNLPFVLPNPSPVTSQT